MSSGKHILILSPGFAEHDRDYLCIPPLQAYLPALQARYPEWKVSVFALQYPYKKYKYQWGGFEIRAFGGANKRRKKLVTWSKTMRAFQRLHKAQAVDVIHSLWMQECAMVGARLARRHALGHVVTIMGQDALPENRYLGKLQFDAMNVVAISERAGNHFEMATGHPVDAVIPWGLSAAELAWSPNGVQRTIDVLGVGSFTGVKKYERFVRVIAALAESRPDLNVVLVGDGPLRGELEAHIADLGLQDRIRLTGILPRPEVLKLMGKSKVLVHPALYEAQGYVFLEALSRGMHVCSGEVGIAREMDKWKLCPHTIAFVEAAAGFLSQPVDEAPRQLYNMDDTVEAYAAIYKDP